MKIPQVKFDLFYYLFFVVKHGPLKFLARLKQNHRFLQQTIFTLGILNICLDSSRELSAEWTTYAKFQTLLIQVRNS